VIAPNASTAYREAVLGYRPSRAQCWAQECRAAIAADECGRGHVIPLPRLLVRLPFHPFTIRPALPLQCRPRCTLCL
jgi:hypothetical protein